VTDRSSRSFTVLAGVPAWRSFVRASSSPGRGEQLRRCGCHARPGGLAVGLYAMSLLRGRKRPAEPCPRCSGLWRSGVRALRSWSPVQLATRGDRIFFPGRVDVRAGGRPSLRLLLHEARSDPTPAARGILPRMRLTCLSVLTAAVRLLVMPRLAAQQPPPPASPPHATRCSDERSHRLLGVGRYRRVAVAHVTPPKGDYTSIPLSDEGRACRRFRGNPATDGSCKA